MTGGGGGRPPIAGAGRVGRGGHSSSLAGDIGRGVRWEGETVPLPLPSSVLSDESRMYLCFISFTDCLFPCILLPDCGLLLSSMAFLSGLRIESSDGGGDGSFCSNPFIRLATRLLLGAKGGLLASAGLPGRGGFVEGATGCDSCCSLFFFKSDGLTIAGMGGGVGFSSTFSSTA